MTSNICAYFIQNRGSSGGSVIKNLPASAGDASLLPGSGRSIGEGNGDPLQNSCLGNPMDKGAWWATVYGGTKELDMIYWLNENNIKHAHVVITESRQVADCRDTWTAEKHVHFLDKHTHAHNLQQGFLEHMTQMYLVPYCCAQRLAPSLPPSVLTCLVKNN